jgi:hypothetical protein
MMRTENLGKHNPVGLEHWRSGRRGRGETEEDTQMKNTYIARKRVAEIRV